MAQIITIIWAICIYAHKFSYGWRILNGAVLKVLMLGQPENSDDIIRCLEAGANGYILQNELVDGLGKKCNELMV